MAVSPDRKYSSEFVRDLLDNVKGKTLGEVDQSNQFARTVTSNKITGIAGDVIEQSVFGYDRDSNQECDIEIDGQLTELKTTGVRIPKTDLRFVEGKTGFDYNKYFKAKEGISITGVTFEPTIQTDFLTSHFWEKSERLLIVFYEYKSYSAVPASEYANFRIVDYCYNQFSEQEKSQLRGDWEIVSSYLKSVYDNYSNSDERNRKLVGFTHLLRPQLLLIELVPAFKKRSGSDSYQKPRYRLKKTFIDTIVSGHFNNNRNEFSLSKTFTSFADLDARCRQITNLYKDKTLTELASFFGIPYSRNNAKNIGEECIVRMFGTDCKKLNSIVDFKRTGIIAKTVTVTSKETRTEDMKLSHIDFDEWCDRDLDFEESEIFSYFSEHSFLCPIFCELEENNPEKTIFKGFKRLSFDDDFIQTEVKRTWEDTRTLVHTNSLIWEYKYDSNGNKIMNSSGSYSGAPNFPKSNEYLIFLRGSATDSSEKYRTECVNGIQMLPQYFWIKGKFITDQLRTIDYL